MGLRHTGRYFPCMEVASEGAAADRAQVSPIFKTFSQGGKMTVGTLTVNYEFQAAKKRK